MFAWLTYRILAYVAAALAVAVLGLSVALWAAGVQSEASIAKLERGHSEAMGKIRKEKEDETAKVRATEKRMTDAADKTRNFHEKQLDAKDIIIAGLRTAEANARDTNVGLRRDLAAYTARRPANNPACPDDPRPAALGLLLDEAIRINESLAGVARESTEGAERHASEVRTLKLYALTVCRGQ